MAADRGRPPGTEAEREAADRGRPPGIEAERDPRPGGIEAGRWDWGRPPETEAEQDRGGIEAAGGTGGDLQRPTAAEGSRRDEDGRRQGRPETGTARED
jgi:hypothetical protein